MEGDIPSIDIALCEEVSGRIGRKYERDQDDLRQNLALKLLEKGHTIRDSHPLVQRQWLTTTAKFESLNEIRSEKRLVQFIAEPIEEGLTDTDARLVVVSPVGSVADTQNQELYQREIEEACIKVGSSATEVRIFKLWLAGYKALEIAAELNIKPPSKVYPLLKNIQRKVVNEIGLEPHSVKTILGADSSLEPAPVVCASR